jgi:transcriptional regulator with GAF, ATPase, and Fis domain
MRFDGAAQLIGASAPIEDLRQEIDRVARTDAKVLITGESGAGKEIVARQVYALSTRSSRPFVAVNCAGLPETLLESELFGHVRGAFTNAISSREGRFALANGGTIFLDEIGDMSPNLQVKLLRVLQERTFEPVGSAKTETVNVRVIAATNQDLETAIRDGRFREDLFYRLNVIPIEVPPLRQRREDIPLLVMHFLEVLNQERGTKIESISDTALDFLCRYDWPGNVRELENLMERITVLRGGGDLDESDLPESVRRAPSFASDVENGNGGESDFRAAVDRFQSDLIRDALARSGGNKKEAAEFLGLNRTTLIEKIKKLGLD